MRKLYIGLPLILAGCGAPSGDYPPDESNENEDTSTGGQSAPIVGDTESPAMPTGGSDAMLATGGSMATGGGDVVGAGGSEVVGTGGAPDATGGFGGNCIAVVGDNYRECVSGIPDASVDCAVLAIRENCMSVLNIENSSCFPSGDPNEAYFLSIADCYESSALCFEGAGEMCSSDQFADCSSDRIACLSDR